MASTWGNHKVTVVPSAGSLAKAMRPPDEAAGRGLSAREPEACARASAPLNVAFRTRPRPAAAVC